MSDIAILKEMFKKSATVPLSEDPYNKRKRHVKLREEGDTRYSVTINGMPRDDEVIIIKADAFKSPDTVFNGSMGECKRADFVIISQISSRGVILCIELKANKDAENKIIQQLTGAKCFVTYCKEIGKEFWQQTKFLDNYEYRFVSIGHINIPKKQTIEKSLLKLHDRPDRMLKIDYPNYLQFNHLIGKP